jgi:hypothetical protein
MEKKYMPSQDRDLIRYINLKLASMGEPTSRAISDPQDLETIRPLLRNLYQKDQLLGRALCPVDNRIQMFLDDYLKEVCPRGAARLPSNAFVLDRPGLARSMSLPVGTDSFVSAYLKSYRVSQGVLHNPKSDRRTTKGLFHIVDGGFPAPDDKAVVPKQTFALLLAEALKPPTDLLTLPFTADQEDCARIFVSLLMRPLVCPSTGKDPAKTMEVRFFAPGSLVSNLDFVESIFGNAGDPYLPENDAALDVDHWTGHTGCVILAPHLVGLKKQALGLPHWNDATDRQRRDGMCWKDESEPYNGGGAFKVACRDSHGLMVTIIADNYFGYCKKEVKTQISFSANLFGLAEEEHSGGAIAFPSYILGQEFYAEKSVMIQKVPFDRCLTLLRDRIESKPEGYATDKNYSGIFYVPEDAEFSVREGFVKWTKNGEVHRLPLGPEDVFVLPSGYKIRMQKQQGGGRWRLVASRAEGTLCHKPCTVSGGGKSEISKSIANVLQTGSIYIKDYKQDFDQVTSILGKDFAKIYKEEKSNERSKRPLLSPERSLGSVVRLLTPSPEYTDEYNDWLHKLPQTIRLLIFVVKRYWQPEWGDDWRQHFSVDRINGYPGHELKYDEEKLIANYLRVGFEPDGSWRLYKTRTDFHPADKVQVEDDITASVVLPREQLSHLDSEYQNPSVKLVVNCEEYLFQRPDDAIYRGFDKGAEADIATPGTFLSNFEPLTLEQARALVEHVVEFDRYTEPMKRLLEDFANHHSTEFVVSSAHPRLVDGKPSKNPRYLQRRSDVSNARETYLAEVGARLARGIPEDQPVLFPVNAVLAGRRNNPPDPKIELPALAVFNPIHFQELPELIMDFICSLTGKSPSTTGFGSEGALTKGPFNALWPVVDMNNMLVSMILTDYHGFTTAAGNVGPKFQVDHDISMLVPEIWCRMRVSERDPKYLMENGYLEKVNDFDYKGRRVLASRLGYRITDLFVDHFLGRIFETPNTVFTDEILRPEKQDLEIFTEGVDSIVEAQTRVARYYFADGSVDAACPPLKAILHIMANGQYEGKPIDHPDIRSLFRRDSLIASDWYRERLQTKQSRDIALWRHHLASLEAYRSSAGATRRAPLDLESRLAVVRAQMERVNSATYLDELIGTIGADPFHLQMPGSERPERTADPRQELSPLVHFIH